MRYPRRVHQLTASVRVRTVHPIRVVNRHLDRECVEGGCRVYVGRPSELGNPFKIGRDGTRDEVIRKYRRWLWERIRSNDAAVVGQMERLIAIAREQPLELACHCSPASCHADIIASALRSWARLELSFN